MAVWCTKQSFAPPSGVMKPKPFSSLNHFTVPDVRIPAPRGLDDVEVRASPYQFIITRWRIERSAVRARLIQKRTRDTQASRVLIRRPRQSASASLVHMKANGTTCRRQITGDALHSKPLRPTAPLPIYNHMVAHRQPTDPELDRLFRALADATRRDIVARLLA